MGNDTSAMKGITNNDSGDRIDFLLPQSYSTVTTILTVLPIAAIIVVIVLGNALVILAVLRDERMKNKVQNWLIVSLSVADMLVGIVIMPLTLSYEVLGRWTLGTALCEIWLALDVLFVTASILNLCVISIDRYWSLTNPIYSATKRTRTRTITMIACIWILAFAICLPPLAGWRPQVRIAGKCNLSEDVGYVLYSSLGSFYIPLAILIFIYVKIFRITRRRAQVQRRKVRRHENLLLLAGSTSDGKPLRADQESSSAKRSSHPAWKSPLRLVTRTTSNGRTTSCTIANTSSLSVALPSTRITACSKGTTDQCTTGGHQGKRSSSGNEAVFPGLLLKPLELQLRMMQHRKQVRRKERQATVLLGLILGAFTVCWLPFFCIYLLGALCCKTPELVFDIVFWMGYCNSGLNPFIYNFFNPDFRVAFRKILCRHRRRM